ncbi:MAG: hypothetical protein U0270_42880 [Labilithrix sp.]
MNTKLGMASLAGALALFGCASDADDASDDGGEETVLESPLVEGAVAASTCLRVDARVVHSTLNVRSSPDIPEPDEAENIRAMLPPTGARSFMTVLHFQKVGAADATENGWWYHVRFQLESGRVGDGWVKGSLVKATVAGGGEPAACGRLRQAPAPSVEVPITTAQIHGARCLRVIEGDAQAEGLVLRSTPEVTEATRIGAIGPRAYVRIIGWTLRGARDWYWVKAIDLTDGKAKVGWVSGRGNFVDAPNQCSAIPPTGGFIGDFDAAHK